MACTLVWSIFQIFVILMLVSISDQMSIMISKVHRTGPCRFDDCWPLYYRVCVNITTDVRTCSSTLDDCNNMSHCSDMRMTSAYVQSINLPPQNTSNKTAIGIYMFEKKMLTIDCRTPISYDCRPIAASYSVNITQFSFQVTITNLLESSSANPTTTTAHNQPSSTTVSLSSTTSNTNRSIGKSTRKEDEKTWITGVVVGSVVGSVVGVVLMILTVILCFCCRKQKWYRIWKCLKQHQTDKWNEIYGKRP